MAKGRKVLTTGQVAKFCNVSMGFVCKWFDSGLLKGYILPASKDRRIPLIELERFMRAHNIPIPSELEQLLKNAMDTKTKKKKYRLASQSLIP